MKKLLGLLAATGLVASTSATVVSCESGGANKIKVDSPEKIELTKTTSEKEVKIDNWEDTKIGKLSVKSSDEKIVKVSTIESGKFKITAIANGTADVIISSDDKDVKDIVLKVTVKGLEDVVTTIPEINSDVTGEIKLTKDNPIKAVTISNWESKDLGTLSVSTDNDKIAKVDAVIKGKFNITAIGDGSAKITIKSNKTDVKAIEIKVEVSGFTIIETAPIVTPEISLDKTEVFLTSGDKNEAKIKINNLKELGKISLVLPINPDFTAKVDGKFIVIVANDNIIQDTKTTLTVKSDVEKVEDETINININAKQIEPDVEKPLTPGTEGNNQQGTEQNNQPIWIEQNNNQPGTEVVPSIGDNNMPTEVSIPSNGYSQN